MSASAESSGRSLAGRRIEIIAPSGAHLSLAEFDQARAWFEARGVQLICEVPRTGWQRFSAPDDDRLAAIHRAASRTPALDAVMITRGGYGLSRLIDRIDWPLIAASVAQGTRWIGYSDFTAFQLALLAQTGAGSYAGPSFSADFSGEGPGQFTHDQFMALFAAGPAPVRWRFAGVKKPLDLQGVLWGGNLAMVSSLVGTPWLPSIERGILFLEDVGEHPYRLERMLHQLFHAGVLARQQALVLGDFTGWKLAPHDRGYGLEAMIDYWRMRLDIPIITGLPFGHGEARATLAVGEPYRLRAEAGFALLERLGKA
jgi:muramoyltetrapeptide carboxypeptidase